VQWRGSGSLWQRPAPAYWLVLVLVVASGLGSAAYHPEGSKFAAYTSGHRRASGMSLFSIGGNLGFGVRADGDHAARARPRPHWWAAARAALPGGRGGPVVRVPFLGSFAPEPGRPSQFAGPDRPGRLRFCSA
jgi:hypothetical protein